MESHQTANTATPQLDYSPLSQHIGNVEALRSMVKKYRSSDASKQASLIAAVAVAVTVYCVVVMISVTAASSAGQLFLVIPALVAILIIITIATSLSNHRNDLRVESFAEKNGLNYKEHTTPGITYTGTIFNHGHSKSIVQALDMSQLNNVEIGNYTYVTGSGKSSTVHDYGYVKVKLSKHLPHMLLDAKSNNMFSFMGNLPSMFGSDQKLMLEGDFNKYFTLYTPKQYETDALYIFTPDVMQTFIDSARDYDVEIVDDYMYLYSNEKFNLAKADEISGLLTIVARLAKDLAKQVKLYSDDNLPSESNGIAEHGRRLKTSRIPAVLTAIVFIGIILFNIVTSGSMYSMLVYAPFVILLGALLFKDRLK